MLDHPNVKVVDLFQHCIPKNMAIENYWDVENLEKLPNCPKRIIIKGKDKYDEVIRSQKEV